MVEGSKTHTKFMNGHLSNEKNEWTPEERDFFFDSFLKNEMTPIDDKIAEVKKKIKNAADEFQKFNKSPLLIHFDELQIHWTAPYLEKADRENKELPVSEIDKYFLTGFTDAMASLFHLRNIVFALTGTAVGTYEVIRYSSAAKPHKISLNCPDLNELLLAETNLLPHQIEECKLLAGCPRAVQFFIQEMIKSKSKNLSQCVERAYTEWSRQTVPIYKDYERKAEIYDELMIAMMFFDAFGGSHNEDSDKQIYQFPKDFLPPHWLKHANAGLNGKTASTFSFDFCFSNQ